jgi:acetyl-CoA carboxylase biotin carboxylase subunit
VEHLTYPGGLGVRIDSMVHAGTEILPFYDSMIAKLIVHGDDREQAISRGLRALGEFSIEGISSTVNLHKEILQTDKFQDGYFTTDFIGKEFLAGKGKG